MWGHILEEPFFNFHINFGRHPFLYMSSVTGLLPLEFYYGEHFTTVGENSSTAWI